MTMTTTAAPYRQTTFQIIGFERLHFISDITATIPQSEYCRLTNLSFEVNGVRVDGWLTVQVQDERQTATIDRWLRAVRGLVSVKQNATETINQ